jgi:hypothetical protein
MSKTSSPAATPRNTTTSRNLKIRTAIKVGVINNPMYEPSGTSGASGLYEG